VDKQVTGSHFNKKVFPPCSKISWSFLHILAWTIFTQTISMHFPHNSLLGLTAGREKKVLLRVGGG
jgi:hypothetical protein